ncbi:MAG: GNAT family N-acetyltransferase [Mycobacterium leprae]
MDKLYSLEQHWLACMATAGGGGRVTRLAGATVVANPRVDGTFLNFIWLHRMQPEALAATLAAAGALLSAYDRRPALFLSPAAGEVEQLAERLRLTGWVPVLHQVVLASPLPQPERRSDPAITVTSVGREQLPLWGQTLVDAYGVSTEAADSIRRGWTALMADPGEGAKVSYYLATLEGQSVGTGLTWSQGGIAALYCGAVNSAFRRRGVHRALMQRRLTDAAREGNHLAVLQTEKGSPVEHLCTTHLGFTLAYERQMWLPPTAVQAVSN